MIALTLAGLAFSQTQPTAEPVKDLRLNDWPASVARPAQPGERHLRNVRQLTFGGQNAEAYWSADGKRITFQTRQPEWPDEQIIVMNADGSGRKLVSTGLGRCTCSYFTPDGKWIYFSSTHDREKGAQEKVDMSKGYVWMVNPNFSLYRVRPDGTGMQKVLDLGCYVAETTIAPNGKFMVWTANEGDVDIYRSDLGVGNVKKLTNTLGYDGGPFISWDSNKIVYRRSAPFQSMKEIRTYTDLLAQNLVRPSRMDLWLMDADGGNNRQVTDIGGASFAPFMSPDSKKIIFCSNYEDKQGREFNLYLVGADGKNLEPVTTAKDFDGFPMFTRDGKRLLFASNRFGSVPGETNIFVADWVD